MAEFLTTNGTSNCIEQIILRSNKKLILVSPYLKISKTHIERLMDASNRGVSIKIIYGKSDLTQRQKEDLAKLENLELYFFENLHAKCYFNEKSMVITSMNFYESSEKTNREMGISIDRNNDKEIFESAVNETHSILKASQKEILRKEEVRTKEKEKEKQKEKDETKQKNPVRMFGQAARGWEQKGSLKAYCIRCGIRIKKDINDPFCDDCSDIWHIYRNEDFEENYCHTCGGTLETTSMRKPICYSCFTMGRLDN